MKPVRTPTLVIFVCAAVDKVPASVPPVTVPDVVIAEEPTSILPNPDVIDPAFKAPTLVIFVCAAVASVPVIDVLAVRVVNVPAAGVAPPITVPSIVPPSMSGVLISVIINYMMNFFGIIGKNEKVTITLSIWGPLIILFLISLIGLIRINEK